MNLLLFLALLLPVLVGVWLIENKINALQEEVNDLRRQFAARHYRE